MTEREGTPPSTVDVPASGGIPSPRVPEPDTSERLSPLAAVGVTTTAVLGLGWFVVSWRIMKSPLTDAIGETVGSLAVVLLVVSVVGASRR